MRRGSGWTPCSRKSSAWRSRGQIRAALATFVAFVFVGLVPLIPFVIPDLSIDTRFFASAVAMALAFFGVGAAKGAVLHRSALRSGLETLLTGGGAALLAYVVGAWLRTA